MTEQLPYTVVRAFPRFDVRRYPACVLVQVRVDAGVARAAAVGARELHRFLSGGNQAEAAFRVTAPLLQEPTGESQHLVSVALPPGTDPAAVPLPLDDSVRIRSVAAHEAAALRFGGGWTGKRLSEHSRELLAHVTAVRLEPSGGVYFARLDPPWKPGFLARHEALVRVISA
ncbi:SOUL family heme-binding protein [Cryobacterium sp. AP23]